MLILTPVRLDDECEGCVDPAVNWTDLTQLGGHQVTQHQSVGGVGHEEAIAAHDLNLIYLVVVERLENDTRARRQVLYNHLQDKHRH